ncbi:MAG: FGGY-family carbohydrate kinase, partial [Bryobacteraceae bacterium]
LAEPVVNDRSLALNLTNEIGAGGRIRLLKNIAGLWLLQECRRAWALDGQDFSYEELTRLAREARPHAALIDPDAFIEPSGMPAQIDAWCRKTGQPPPGSPAQYARVILESLALRYREVLEMIEDLLGRRLAVIHIVGGGSRNDLLNQFVADSTGRAVVAGPAEATAIGNVLVQAIGSGAIAGLDEARALVRRSFEVREFAPAPSADWDAARARYRAICRTAGTSAQP